jgi:glycosyltransferase involved in cell wall biosynthesis
MPAFRDAFLRFADREAGRDGGRYDLIHGNFWMSGWVAVELGERLGLPVVQIFHALGKTKRREQGADDTSPSERIAVEKEIVRRADRILAQCPAEVEELTRDYAADPAKIAVTPAGMDPRRFQPVAREEARRYAGVEAHRPVVVYVGRMLPRKDVRNVVRGFARLLERWQDGRSGRTPLLLLVGGETVEPDPAATPEIGVLQALAADLGVADHVRFVGKRQPDELRYYYAAGDVAVTTPWYEPFGLTPLEAMGCGRPVIGADVGGISYTVQHGTTGYLVPPRDPEALAARLFDLLARPELCAARGRAARARVEREFTWERVAQRVAAVYQSVLGPAMSDVDPAAGASVAFAGEGQPLGA